MQSYRPKDHKASVPTVFKQPIIKQQSPKTGISLYTFVNLLLYLLLMSILIAPYFNYGRVRLTLMQRLTVNVKGHE